MTIFAVFCSKTTEFHMLTTIGRCLFEKLEMMILRDLQKIFFSLFSILNNIFVFWSQRFTDFIRNFMVLCKFWRLKYCRLLFFTIITVNFRFRSKIAGRYWIFQADWALAGFLCQFLFVYGNLRFSFFF